MIKKPEEGHDSMCGRRIWGPDASCGCAVRAKQQASPTPTPARTYPHACCARAQPLQCVCAYAYTCPEHGTKHIGTHD